MSGPPVLHFDFNSPFAYLAGDDRLDEAAAAARRGRAERVGPGHDNQG